MAIMVMAVLQVLCWTRGIIEYIGQMMGDGCVLTGKQVPLITAGNRKWWLLTEMINTGKRLIHQFL